MYGASSNITYILRESLHNEIRGCTYVCVLAVGLRGQGVGARGGEAARVSRLPLWCERHGLAGGGGRSPFVTSILHHKCGNAFRVKIHSFYYRDSIRKQLFYLNE